MAIEHITSFQAAAQPEKRGDYFVPKHLLGKLPPQLWQFIDNHFDLEQIVKSPVIDYTVGEAAEPLSALLKQQRNRLIIVNTQRMEGIWHLREHLLELNQSLEVGGCLIGSIDWGISDRVGKRRNRLAALFRKSRAKGAPPSKRPRERWDCLDLETCGRLFAHGFKILELAWVGEVAYFVARKAKDQEHAPVANVGSFIRLRRVGKQGQPIDVYKLRTMFPYSEYLQGYIYEVYGLQSGGKMKDDPRVTPFGRFFRRYWLDELPMLFNLLAGELKIIGVRPISSHYLSLYPEEFRNFRCQFKPGLLPPFYYDLPSSLEEIIASERRYLEAYARQPLLTDLRYFFVAAYNILIKGVRSS